ncbi:MAG: LamG domain-containing protein [Acidimicrobiales bacterium]|nr:LamG domain-containing protein [Acidimicrobiales bacterium]
MNGSTSQIVASQPITNPTAYSEEMWFKTTTTTGGLLEGFGSAPSGTTSVSRDRVVFMANNGQLYFGVYARTPITIHSPLSYNDGRWHQVVAAQGPDGMHLYVDGQQVTSDATTTGAQSYLGYWKVGAENLAGWSNSPTSNYFAGSVSDVAFYNAELTSGQVLTHYQAIGGSCPSSWSCTDIGGALPPGQQNVTGSTWSVSGGGGDIWGAADSFRLLNQTLAADGTVTAHVTAQSNTGPWAKAGVMLRATTNPGSPYYATFVTSGNGVVVQLADGPGRVDGSGCNTRHRAHLSPGRALHDGRQRLLHRLHLTRRHDVDRGTRIDSGPDRAGWHPPGRIGCHLPQPGYEFDGRLRLGVGDGHRVPAARLQLSDRLDLFGHRGPVAARPADVDRHPVVAVRRGWRHLGDGRLIPLRRQDADCQREHLGSCDGTVEHGTVGQGGRHAQGHHRPGLALLCRLRDTRPRGRGPVADGSGRADGAGGDTGRRAHLSEGGKDWRLIHGLHVAQR